MVFRVPFRAFRAVVVGMGMLRGSTARHTRNLTFSGSDQIPEATDCAIRAAAWDYGKKLQPKKGAFTALFDALQLDACGLAPPPPGPGDRWTAPRTPIPLAAVEPTLYVLPTGTALRTDLAGLPAGTFTSLGAAVAASRAMAKPLTIALRGGLHCVAAPVALGPADSGVTIRNAPGEEATVSAGVDLTTAWRPSAACTGCWETPLKGQVTDVQGLRRDGIREIRARYPNHDPELNAVIDGQYLVHDGKAGMVNSSAGNWIEAGAPGMNGLPGVWPPSETATSYTVGAADWPGVDWPMSIMTNTSNGSYANRDTWTGEGDWGQYWLGSGGPCADRSPPAGYWCAPGAPRKIGQPTHSAGFLMRKAQLPNLPYANAAGGVLHAWGKDHWYTNIFELGAQAPPPPPPGNRSKACTAAKDMNYGSGFIAQMGTATYSACCDACANNLKCLAWDWNGKTCYLKDNSATKIAEKGRWSGTLSPPAAAAADEDTAYFFTRGGTQGGEGVNDAGWSGQWYIENVIEELDVGREWFFDNRTFVLYYKPNVTSSSAAAPPTGRFVATQHQVLFNVTGSQAAPAHHIVITGLTLRDTVATYFEPHGLPSGGDWALQKTGAITLVGTENITISDNLLTRLDGNGVFIGGYNRNLAITDNEFTYIGGSAMAAWGDTSTALSAAKNTSVPWPIGPDGRGGDQPRGVRVIGNIVQVIGVWEKQSAAWFQAVTALTELKNNVFFNGPRAAVNLNDGFGGGDELAENLLLNMVRESKDHGPYNSWDRVPYITNLRYGRASIVPADRHIHHNFVIANYNSEGAIDTDDGSAYYRTHHNFFAYGANGLKSDFGGHDNHHFRNIYAYVGGCFGAPMPWRYFRGLNNEFTANTCITHGKFDII